MTTTPTPDGLPADQLEAAAKSVYEKLPADRTGDAKTFPWQPGGNSFKQDEARLYARAALEAVAAATHPAPAGDAVAVLRYKGDEGGEYAEVGVAKGAGTARGNLVHVYREPASGQLFYRTPMDFAERMERTRAGAAATANAGPAAATDWSTLRTMMAIYRNMPHTHDDESESRREQYVASILAHVDARAARWAAHLVGADAEGSRMVTRIMAGANDARKELDDLRAQLAHWKSNHDQLAARCAILRERDDLPVDRLPAYRELVRLQEASPQLARPADLAGLTRYDEISRGDGSLLEEGAFLRFDDVQAMLAGGA